MPRYKLTLEYDGTPFYGWQRQENVPSVQQAIETAIFDMSGETVTLAVAGRTDKGVHAIAQVAHCDLEQEVTPFRLQEGLNAHLRFHPITVRQVESVSEEFHARFSARKRHYRYRILNRRTPPALERNRVWHVKQPLDLTSMQMAAQKLLGQHDFSSFRHQDCYAKTPIKTIDALTLERAGEEIHLIISAPSFLYHMVRNITGTLKKIGEGQWSVEKIDEILAAKNRIAAGPTAPPEGLYFMEVEYEIKKN